jgi:hypothetical protein
VTIELSQYLKEIIFESIVFLRLSNHSYLFITDDNSLSHPSCHRVCHGVVRLLVIQTPFLSLLANIDLQIGEKVPRMAKKFIRPSDHSRPGPSKQVPKQVFIK